MTRTNRGTVRRTPLPYRPNAGLLALSCCLLTTAASAQLTWDPVSGNNQIDAGSGTWDATTVNWTSDGGISNVAYGSGTNAVFAGADGTYAVTLGANLTGQTALRFNASGYTLSAASARTLSSSSGTYSIWPVTNKTATIGTNITATSGSTSNPSLQVTGGGELVLEAGATLTHTSATQGRIRLGSDTLGGANVRIRSGAKITSPRLVALALGSCTIEGGSVLVSSSSADTDALQLGNVFNGSSTIAPVTLDMNSGTIVANGTRDGIVLSQGGSGNNGNGGYFNLNGGSVTSVTVKAQGNQATYRKRIFNFNGGLLVVSPAATQTQLNSFIAGFAADGNSSVNLLAGGARIDTGSINTGTTDGAATIVSVVRGAVGGAFTKLGANTLVLAAANTYNGETRVEAGTLKLATSGGITNSSGVRVSRGATFDVSALSGGFTVAGGQSLGGSGVVTGAVTLASGAKLAMAVQAPGTGGALAFKGCAANVASVVFNQNVVDFAVAENLPSGTYTLFTFDAENAYSGHLAIGTGLEGVSGTSLSYRSNAIDLVVLPKGTVVLVR